MLRVALWLCPESQVLRADFVELFPRCVTTEMQWHAAVIASFYAKDLVTLSFACT